MMIAYIKMHIKQNYNKIAFILKAELNASLK